jgi:hypothetical protein
LKIRCDFEGCQQTVSLGELQNHCAKCEQNPEIKMKLKCLCEKEFSKKEFNEHKNNCLEFVKKELKISRYQLSTFSANINCQNQNQIQNRSFSSEAHFLYSQLLRSLPQKSSKYNKIEDSLVYLSWKLMSLKRDVNRYHIERAFIDISVAISENYDYMKFFLKSNGLDFMLLCHALFKNKDINRSISEVFKMFCKYSPFPFEVMSKQCIELLLKFLDKNNNKFVTSFNAVTTFSLMTDISEEKWKQLSPNYERQRILNGIKTTISGWKLNEPLIRFKTFKSMFQCLKSEQMPPEVQFRYVWILVYLTRGDCKRYVPMIEEENGIKILKKISEKVTTQSYVKEFIALLIFQCDTYKRLGHLKGLENTDERDITKFK